MTLGEQRKIVEEFYCVGQTADSTLFEVIQAAEQWLDKQDVDIRSMYFDYLMMNSPAFPDRFEGHWAVVRATASQRLEALVRITGKWKESP